MSSAYIYGNKGKQFAQTDKGEIIHGTRVEVETAVNAQSVAPGANVDAQINAVGASEIYVLVNIDKQPWELMSGVPWYPSSAYSARLTFYPVRQNVTEVYSTSVNPCISLYLGINPQNILGLTPPTNWLEARAMHIPPLGTESVRVRNMSSEVATVTIRILKVWR
jgi:hypothetical protein